ncbi:hypothetical protein GCM10009001_08840 [Virgibacillus siamensis]|uniref:Biotin/lipoyl-binding protein n=1 Tax=Virgibacillus siamensis TaxID=480071 RepID=A0ABP3QPK1_9BACI
MMVMEYEVFPQRWGYRQIITSPIKGIVESIMVESGEKIQGQQILAMIREEQGNVKQILTGVDGVVEALDVKVGDKVVRGDVVLFIKEDL